MVKVWEQRPTNNSWGLEISSQSFETPWCLKILLSAPVSIRHLHGLPPMLMIFGWDLSEMLETHQALIEVFLFLTVRTESCLVFMFKGPAVCHLCHSRSNNLFSSGSPYRIRGRVSWGSTIHDEGMTLGHSFFRCSFFGTLKASLVSLYCCPKGLCQGWDATPISWVWGA